MGICIIALVIITADYIGANAGMTLTNIDQEENKIHIQKRKQKILKLLKAW